MSACAASTTGSIFLCRRRRRAGGARFLRWAYKGARRAHANRARAQARVLLSKGACPWRDLFGGANCGSLDPLFARAMLGTLHERKLKAERARERWVRNDHKDGFE